MRVVILAALLALSGVALATPRITLNEALFNFLVDMKEKLRNGDEEMGIPAMDPLTINETHVLIPNPNMEVDFIQMNLDMVDTIVAGIPDYEVNSVNFNILQMKIEASLSMAKLELSTAWYTISAEIMEMVPIFGTGELGLVLENIDAAIVLSLRVNADDTIEVTDFAITLHIGAASSSITGLLDNEEFSIAVNEIIRDVIPSFVNEHEKFINLVVSPIVVQGANTWLNGMTLGDLIDMINPPATEEPPAFKV